MKITEGSNAYGLILGENIATKVASAKAAQGLASE